MFGQWGIQHQILVLAWCMNLLIIKFWLVNLTNCPKMCSFNPEPFNFLVNWPSFFRAFKWKYFSCPCPTLLGWTAVASGWFSAWDAFGTKLVAPFFQETLRSWSSGHNWRRIQLNAASLQTSASRSPLALVCCNFWGKQWRNPIWGIKLSRWWGKDFVEENRRLSWIWEASVVPLFL